MIARKGPIARCEDCGETKETCSAMRSGRWAKMTLREQREADGYSPEYISQLEEWDRSDEQ